MSLPFDTSPSDTNFFYVSEVPSSRFFGSTKKFYGIYMNDSDCFIIKESEIKNDSCPYTCWHILHFLNLRISVSI
jgi:hypothetical protein